MDNFKIVLIILVMFLVCCYLKNNRIFKDDITIFEGLPEAEVPEVQANLQQPSSWRESSTSEATTRPSILNYRSQASTEEVPRQVETDASNERVLNVISRPGGGLCKQTAESYREANAPNSPTAYLKDIQPGEFLPGDWDEGSCTGRTGYSLSWVKLGNRDNPADGTRRSTLNSIEPPVSNSIKKKEDSVEPLDIFSNSAQGTYKFQYRDMASGAITEQNDQVPLLPWKDTAYCLLSDGSEATERVTQATQSAIDAKVAAGEAVTKEFIKTTECESNAGGLWIDPKRTSLLSGDFANFRKNRCGISLANNGPGDGSTASAGKPDCLSKEQLYMPQCISDDGLEVQPKDWWKERWTNGLGVDQLCEGKNTFREWQAESELAGLLDGKTIDYMAARHGTSTTSAAALGDVEATGELKSIILSDLRSREATSAEARQQLTELREQVVRERESPCTLEQDRDGNPYIGNFGSQWGPVENPITGSSAGGYLFSEVGTALQAQNLNQITRKTDGSVNALTCNNVNYKPDPNAPGQPSVTCGNNDKFLFRGCIPQTCRMPQEREPGEDGWHPELYKFKDIPAVDDVHGAGTRGGSLIGWRGGNKTQPGQEAVRIGDLVDTRNGNVLIECDSNNSSSLAPGFENVRVTCNENSSGGDVSIEGCVQNKCSTIPLSDTSPDNNRERYFINTPFDDDKVDVNVFKKANQWATSSTDIGSGLSGDATALTERAGGHRFQIECPSQGSQNLIPNTAVSTRTEEGSIITDVPLIRPEDYHKNPTIGGEIGQPVTLNTYKQPCFSCAAPNNYKVDDNDTTGRLKQAATSWTEESNPHTLNQRFTTGATLSCPTHEGDFTLSGCYENKCMNPFKSSSQMVYDGEKRDFTTKELEKPEWINDTLKVSTETPSDDTLGLYQKYELVGTGPSGEFVTQKELTQNPDGTSKQMLQCGKNYSSVNIAPDSGASDSPKVIPPSNVKCYNIFDWRNNMDTNNKDVPSYNLSATKNSPYLWAASSNETDDLTRYSSIGAETQPDALLVTDSSGNSSLNTNLKDHHNISLSGCEENYCRWPREDNTFDKPRNRATLFQEAEGITDVSNDRGDGPIMPPDANSTGVRGKLGYYTNHNVKAVGNHKNPGVGSTFTPGSGSSPIAPTDADPSGGMVLIGGEGGGDNNPNKNGSPIYTASEWANVPYTGIHNDGLDENSDPRMSYSIQCIGEPDEDGNSKCVPGTRNNIEPEYRNYEIDAMIKKAKDDCEANNAGDSTEINKCIAALFKGQPPKNIVVDGSVVNSELKSQDLHEVGRGGPFTISRCWKKSTSDKPKVTCSRSDSAYSGGCKGDRSTIETSADKVSSCDEANVGGCEQLKCKLRPSDAASGTRFLIEGPNGYQSIGGATNDNMNTTFNVDQIRKVTCDYNFSKVDPSKSFGHVWCDGIQENGEGPYFKVSNPCQKTKCGGDTAGLDNINIVDTQHITDVGYQESGGLITSTTPDQYSRGPGRKWINSSRYQASCSGDGCLLDDTGDQFKLLNDTNQPYLFEYGADGTRGILFQGHYDDFGNTDNEIGGRKDSANPEDTENITKAHAQAGLITPNYNTSWSRYKPTDTGGSINNYDKLNYATPGGQVPNIQENDQTLKQLNTWSDFSSSPTPTSDTTGNRWVGVTHPTVQCNVRSSDSKSGFNLTDADLTAMSNDPDFIPGPRHQVGAIGVSGNLSGGTCSGDNTTGQETQEECTAKGGNWTYKRDGIASCNLERGTIVNPSTAYTSNPSDPSGYMVTGPTADDKNIHGHSIEWNQQPYKVSHCQRRICTYPEADNQAKGTIGYKYSGRAGVGVKDSTANVLGFETGGAGDLVTDANSIVRGRGAVAHEPYEASDIQNSDSSLAASDLQGRFYNTGSNYRDSLGATIQCDNKNFSGTPNVKCNQSSDDYLKQNVPEFSDFSGCNENKCIIPSPSAVDGSVAKALYDQATDSEKEKWDRVERGYELRDPTQVNAINTGVPFSTSLLKSTDEDKQSTQDDAQINFQCNRNFRQSLSQNTIRCPSLKSDGLQAPWVQASDGSWTSNDSEKQTAESQIGATDGDRNYGSFTNLYSSFGLGSLDEQNPSSAVHAGLPAERDATGTMVQPVVDQPICVENKCTLDDRNVDIPVIEDNAFKVNSEGNIDSGDVLYNIRVARCNGGTGAERSEAECSAAGGTWVEPSERERLHPELPGYQFRIYDGDNVQGDNQDKKVWQRAEENYSGITPDPTTGTETINTTILSAKNSPVTTHFMSPRQDWGPSDRSEATSTDHSIRCAANYHESKNNDNSTDSDANKPLATHPRSGSANKKGALITCEGASDDGKFKLSGCSENYCKLPNDSDRNTAMYTYTGNIKTDLENLQEKQNGKLTLRQFNHGQGETLKCAPWTRGTPRIACNWGGLETTGSGAVAGSCTINGNPDPTIATKADCEAAAGGVWEPEASDVNIDSARTPTGDVPEFTFKGCVPLARDSVSDGTYYYEAYPGDCVGYWPGSLSHISDDGKGVVASPSESSNPDSIMWKFMDTCKNNCDINPTCSGFTIQKLGAEEAAKSQAPVGTMVCNQKTSASPGGSPESAGPSDSQCQLEERSHDSWARNWGYDNIYKNFTMDAETAGLFGLDNAGGTSNVDLSTVRHEFIPSDQPIYFEKKITPDAQTETPDVR